MRTTQEIYWDRLAVAYAEPNAAATARSIGRRTRSLRRLRPDLPRELSEEIDACLDPRPRHRPSLEELGGAIEDSLDLLADNQHSGASHVGLRLGAIGLVAALGAVLVLVHGLAI